MKRMFWVAPLLIAALCAMFPLRPAQAQRHVSAALPLPEFTSVGGQHFAYADDIYGPAVTPIGYAPEAIDDPHESSSPERARDVTSVPTVAPCPESNDFLDRLRQPWSAPVVAGCGAGYASAAPCCTDRWFAGAYALWMTRDAENEQFYSYDDTDIANQLISTNDLNFDYTGGVDVRFGRTFCCGQYALEAVYWGVFPGTKQASLYDDDMPGFLNSVWDMSTLNYDNGVDPITSVDTFTDAAEVHRVRRDQDIHNVEINLFHCPLTWASGMCCGIADYGCGGGCGPDGCGGSCYGGCASRLNMSYSFGLRYLYFSDDIQFASSRYDRNWGGDPRGEIFWDNGVENHFIGPQVGFYADYCVTNRLLVNLDTKFGIYGNHINHDQAIYGNNGDAVVGAGPNAGRAYRIDADRNQVSFIGEFDLGLKYHLTQRLRLVGGYRVLAISGVAHPTSQIPYNFAGIQDVEDVDGNGHLLLHGGYVGAEFTW